MNFIQKLYYSDKPIVITNNTRECVAAHPEMGIYKTYTGFSVEHFDAALAHLQDKQKQGVIIEETSPGALLLHLASFFTVIRAGGGVVYNEHGNILMIFRRGKWDLPKGKLDEGETIDECALREVQEETGIQQLTLGSELCETWHLYTEKGKNIVKYTTWYRMTSTDNDPLTPQVEEDIKEARWVNTKELKPFVDNTYKAIKDVLHVAGLHW